MKSFLLTADRAVGSSAKIYDGFNNKGNFAMN